MISIVLPAYNEAQLLESTVKQINTFLRSRKEDYEIIIVENGSVHDTSKIAQRLSTRFKFVKSFSIDKADYGFALRKGFREASGEIVINFDVDFYDFDFLERATRLILESKINRPSIVVGSKRAVGSNDQRSTLRRLATFIFSNMLRVIFGLGVTDTHGIKAFHRASVVEYEQQCVFGRDIFDTELILRCEKAGLFVHEIPVTIKEARPARSALFSRIPRTLRDLTFMKILFIKDSIIRRKVHSHVKIHP